MGLNVSVFLDFNIETVGDVLSLLFSIDDSVNLSLAETPEQKISLTFDNPTMQDFFRKWCQFKNVYEKEKAEILAIENEDKRQEELDKLNATQDEWKLRAMGTTIGCHTIVKKGTEDTIATVYKGNIIKNLIMDCQSYTKYRPNETTGGIFVSWRRKEELPTGA